MYYKAFSGLKMAHPQLGHLMSILEAEDTGWSITEIKRISAKILETSFLNARDDILTSAMVSGRKDEEYSSEGEGVEGEVMDTFIGVGGEIFELRKLKNPTWGESAGVSRKRTE